MEGANTIDLKLFHSSVYGDLEGVRAALAQGGSVSFRFSDGHTPLVVAAMNGHSDICSVLLAHGSDVNEMDPLTKDTALHNAAARGYEALVEVLLSWGADVDHKNNVFGGTPLYNASQEGHLACVLTLLKAGASVSLPTNDWYLPIHIAAVNNRVDIVRALLEHGCSLDMVSCSDNPLATIILTFSFFSATKRMDGHR